MSSVVAFGLVGFGTYVLRASGLLSRDTSSEVSPTLRLIAPVVLAAIVADQLFVGDRAVSVRGEWIAAALVAFVIARWRGSAALTMASGLAVVWLLDWLM